MNGPTLATVTAHHGHPAPTAARPAPPRPAPARPAKADAAAPPPILTYLRLHWLAILFSGGLLGGGLAAVAWSVLPAKYESFALLQVASAPAGVVNQSAAEAAGRTDFVTQLKTTAQLIKSQFVLNSALSDPKHKIADLPTIKDQKDPIKFLTEKLVVTFSESEVITIGLEGDRPEDVQKIVDAVKDAYLREVVEKEIEQKTSLRNTVVDCKMALEAQMKLKPGFAPAGTALAANTPAAAPKNPVVQADARAPAAPVTIPGVDPAAVAQTGALVQVPAGAGAVAAEVLADTDVVKRAKFGMLVKKQAELESELTLFPVQIKERRAAIELKTKELDGLRQTAPSAESVARAEKEPDVLAKQYAARDRRRTYNHLLAALTNASDSEYVKHAKEAAEAAETEAARAKAEKAKMFEAALTRQRADALVHALDEGVMALQSLEERERVAKKVLVDTKKELADMPPEIRRGEDKGPLVDPQQTDLLATNERYRRLVDRQIGLDLELKSPPRVTKRQDASTPSLKDGKKQLLGTVVAGLLGFGLAGLVAVGYETKARKVSSLGEVKTTGPAVVGVIPWQPDGSVNRDPIKRADVGEAVDKLRTYVAQAWLTRGATTVAVTSPLGDEGKAFAAFGLASSLAQAGYKTLLADFDLRNPTLHALAGLPAGATGVCELLRGEADPRSAILALPNGLHVLPAGTWSEDARQAAVGGRLESLLGKIREPFDCVILHAHALLTAAESVEVARRAEVVLLCSLYRETRLPLLKRAADRVSAMEVPYSGIVYLGATSNEALC